MYPHLAATVIIYRKNERAQEEIYLLKRPQSNNFLSEAWVFPGGKLQPQESFEEAAVRETLEETQITLEIQKLIPIFRWITPVSEPRRFDTQFFIYQNPIKTLPQVDLLEHDCGAFRTTAEALEDFKRKEIKLLPPTLATLEALHDAGSIHQFLQNPPAPHTPIEPQAVLDERGLPALVLPGDPLYSPPTAPILNKRTRFSFKNGAFV